jgi:hypothetical protein
VDRGDLEHRYLNTVGAAIFGDPTLNFGALVDAEAALVVGPDAFSAIETGGGVPPKACAFDKTGIYALRSDCMELFIRCGTNGQDGNGGHAHNDKLSFELTAEGNNVVVDPGTGVYTSDPTIRNLFRSTEVHSTCLIDGKEQSPLFPTQLFYLPERCHARALRYEPNETGGIFVGRLEGLAVTLTRTFRLEGRKLIIIDELDKPSSIAVTLPLSPDARASVESSAAFVRVNDVTLRVESLRGTESVQWQVVPQKYSAAYGRVEDSPALKLKTLARRLETSISLDVGS